jgi:hypothetical protein
MVQLLYTVCAKQIFHIQILSSNNVKKFEVLMVVKMSMLVL